MATCIAQVGSPNRMLRSNNITGYSQSAMLEWAQWSKKFFEKYDNVTM